MAEKTNAEKPKGAAPPARSGGTTPLFAILLMIFAVAGGAFLRFPDARLVTEQNAAVSAEARESVEAAQSMLKGQGFTVSSGGTQKQTRLAAGEPMTVAVSYMVLGQKPQSPLYLQFALSTAAIALLALGASAVAGGWAGAAAAVLLATWPGQIEATRAISMIPATTFFGSAAVCAAAFALRAAKGAFTGMLIAGVFAGLGAAIHPIFLVVSAGLLIAAMIQFSWRAMAGAVAGAAIGLAPILIQRFVVYHSPLVSSERFAVSPGMTGFQYFDGTAGMRLADWVGADATAVSLAFDKGYFQHLYQNPAHVALFAIAALGLLAILQSAARGMLALAIGVAGALLAIPMIAGNGAGLPLTRATESFYVFVALAGALGAGMIARLRGLGALIAILIACAPAAVKYQDLLEIAKRAPGILAPKPADTTPAGPESAPSNITNKGAEAATPEVNPTVNEPKPVVPVNENVAVEPRVDPPKPPEKVWHMATAQELAIAKKTIDGEGGLAAPTAALEENTILLNLRLDRNGLDVTPMAARLSLKILREIPALDRLRVRIQDRDGKTLSNSIVLASKARQFIEKLDDPFQARRAGEWWSQMKQ